MSRIFDSLREGFPRAQTMACFDFCAAERI